uniref:5'-3' exoribonuclease n=1 Tax=Aquila chrysaetos chrysaetos TaxID=223781 RepID=A0A663EAE1_AQUCH
MGVPAFFRWLSRKYPSIIVNCVEEKAKECNGVKAPIDTSKPNPNEVEFDNLYLDMNGIIHPCTHPEDKPAPKNEDEMMVAIFEYIDRIFNIVRPRRLLYMAIDGVAPRAKMNQQRSRRFRASKEGMEAAEEKQKIRREILAKGRTVTMFNLYSSNLTVSFTVILSDASAPGEGEHKIMDYIRRQRAQPNHDPNTHHCLCGADADLIMLGLATHEPNFTIIREEFKPNKPKPCALCNQMGHEVKDCQGLPREKQGKHDQFADSLPIAEQEFIFIRLCVLREYLERELTMASLPFTFDFERSVDDWVFMCFFVGNDFLPHLPSLEIREGAIDRLVNIYKNVVHKTGGYLTESGFVNLQRVQMIMLAVGEVEDSIFRKRKDDDDNFKRRQKEKRKRMKRDQPSFIPGGQFSPQALGNRSSPQAISNPRQAAFEMRMHDRQNSTTSSSPNTSLTSDGSPSLAGGIKRKAEDSDSEPEPEDNIRLWETGWKQRYYKNKFDVDASDEKFRRKVVQSYVEGLCWVLRYYYQGCASWNWYYPFHYAPFASDFEGIADMPSDFEKGSKPFKPLEQLMGVFPAASGNFLPPTWRKLMTDPESSIIDFYPEDFAIDLNGKKYAWQGVALLPFVDERRLRAALEEVYPDLTPEESRRNSLGGDVLFVGKHHPLCDFIVEQYKTKNTEPVDIPPELCHGIQGKLTLNENAVLPDHVTWCKVSISCQKPAPVLKPGDWEKTNNDGRPWRPQLSFNRDRKPVHLDQSAFRTLGHTMPRERGMPGMYANAVPLGTYGSPYTRPLLSGQQQIPKLLSRAKFMLQCVSSLHRTAGAAPLLAWNRMLQSQNQYQPSQYQGLGGPMSYPQRPEDRMDRGRQVSPRCV